MEPTSLAELARAESPIDGPILTIEGRVESPLRWRIGQAITALIVGGPLLGVLYAGFRYWGHGINWFDLTLLVVLYLVSGFGMAVGYHRLFTHRAFVAKRWLKIALAVAGSLCVEGSVISWVALHRRHHAYADLPLDPHSPARFGPSHLALWKGLFHAHVGWLFKPQAVEVERWCPELAEDADLAKIAALAPAWPVISLALPFLLGLAVTRTFSGALLALLWGGLVRVACLHHMTWSVNSIAHTFGKRPFKTGDLSTNVSWMALISLGDSWHNNHHAFPALARHGFSPSQVDWSALLIAGFERAGWATNVRWPNTERIARQTQRRPAASATLSS
jgi:stearoyl-CoA desaturase (delta-9 desaturase)